MTASVRVAATQSARQLLATMLTDLVAPVVLYYGLRGVGVGIYLSLLISAGAAMVIAIVRLIRSRRIDGLAFYTVTVMILGATVSLMAGSPRFLLSREGWVSVVTGLWFLFSARYSQRPLAYLYSRPFLERRLSRRGVPDDWERLWVQLPQFRQVWRFATEAWGIGLLADAGARVLIAYTLPMDAVPALSAPLYMVTSLTMLTVTNIYYWRVGLFSADSALYRPIGESIESASKDKKPSTGQESRKL